METLLGELLCRNVDDGIPSATTVRSIGRDKSISRDKGR